jgi:hypothetical protein
MCISARLARKANITFGRRGEIGSGDLGPAMFRQGSRAVFSKIPCDRRMAFGFGVSANLRPPAEKGASLRLQRPIMRSTPLV